MLSDYKCIINQCTSHNVNIHGKLDVKILNTYLNILQYGGTGIELESIVPTLSTSEEKLLETLFHMWNKKWKGSPKLQELINIGMNYWLKSRELRYKLLRSIKVVEFIGEIQPSPPIKEEHILLIKSIYRELEQLYINHMRDKGQILNSNNKNWDIFDYQYAGQYWDLMIEGEFKHQDTIRTKWIEFDKNIALKNNVIDI